MLEEYTTGQKLRCLEAMLNNIGDLELEVGPEEDSLKFTVKATKLKSTNNCVVIPNGKDFDILNKMIYDIRNDTFK